MRLPGLYLAALLLLPAACTAGTAPPASLAPHVDCDHPPAPESEGVQGETYKIVWRVTGTGPARFSATGPGSAKIAPAWGPEGPRGSNFDYPGDEWGTGFLFPAPGCQAVHVGRDDMSGSLSLPIT
jgi:hypothetical protein